MPTFRTGDLWRHPHDLTCITTNAVVTSAGLVMGGGIAAAAAQRHPRLRHAAAQALATLPDARHYGFVPLTGEHAHLALFQTKTHYREASSLYLIRHATQHLATYAREHPDTRIALPYPGIGLGRLKPQHVQPLLTALPNNVIVWRLP